jgi:hypothetical protein
MFQDFLEPAKILTAACDFIYGFIGAVVAIFNPSEYREFWLETKRLKHHQFHEGVHSFAISLILII